MLPDDEWSLPLPPVLTVELLLLFVFDEELFDEFELLLDELELLDDPAVAVSTTEVSEELSVFVVLV